MPDSHTERSVLWSCYMKIETASKVIFTRIGYPAANLTARLLPGLPLGKLPYMYVHRWVRSNIKTYSSLWSLLMDHQRPLSVLAALGKPISAALSKHFHSVFGSLMGCSFSTWESINHPQRSLTEDCVLEILSTCTCRARYQQHSGLSYFTV